MQLEMLERRALLSGAELLTITGAGNGRADAALAPSTPGPSEFSTKLFGEKLSTPTTQGFDTTGVGTVSSVAMSNKLRVSAWAPPGDQTASYSGMIWVSIDQDPKAEAWRVAPLLNARQPGDRTVFIAEALYSGFASFDRSNPGAFIAKGWDVSKDRQWCTTFFATLIAGAVPVDRVVTDIELEFTTWTLFDGLSEQEQVAVMRNIYDNPAAYAKLPPEVRAFTPDDFATQFSARGRDAFTAWNIWEHSVFTTAYQTGIYGPFSAVYGGAIPVSNYNDMSPRMAMLDRNGWLAATANAYACGNVNSPELYLWNGLQYNGLKKDWRWNRVIDALNTVRACQNVDNRSVAPWISYPLFRGDKVAPAKSTWLWEQMVRHMVAGGVSNLIYWNPVGLTDPAQEQFADALFKSLTPGTATPESLQPIAFDADSITTNGVTTTYQQFLQCVDNPTATSLGTLDPTVDPSESVPPTAPIAPLPKVPLSTLVGKPKHPASGPTGGGPIDAPTNAPTDASTGPAGDIVLATKDSTDMLQIAAPQPALPATDVAQTSPIARSASILTNQRMGLTSLYEWLDAGPAL
jgi:hypothetical protein